MTEEQINDLVQEVMDKIENGEDEHASLVETVASFVDCNMTVDKCIAFVRVHSIDQTNVFVEPSIDLTDDFERIICTMADNVLCRVISERIQN